MFILLYVSCKGRLKIADLGLSRIFLNNADLAKKNEDEDDDYTQTHQEDLGPSKGLRRRSRQRQYSHQVATRWYRCAGTQICSCFVV